MYLMAGALFLAMPLLAENPYPEMTAQEKQVFEQEVQKALQAAEERVQEVVKRLGEPAIYPSAKIELEIATTQLEVKQTIWQNFMGASSLRSPVVRQKLLELLNKEEITGVDLLEFQKIVNDEKAKMQ